MFQSLRVHSNESALMEMFIMTVISFHVFMKHSVLTCKNQSDLSFCENTVFHILFVNDKFHHVETGDKGFHYLEIDTLIFWTYTYYGVMVYISFVCLVTARRGFFLPESPLFEI